MFICEGNCTVSLTGTHLRRLVFPRAVGRGAGSPKASPRSLTPGFWDQPRVSLATEGAQTRALRGHSFSAFFFPPLQTSPKPRRATGWRRPTSGDSDETLRTLGPSGTSRGSPQSRVRAGTPPRPAAALPRFRMLVFWGQSAWELARRAPAPGRHTKEAAGDRVMGELSEKAAGGQALELERHR